MISALKSYPMEELLKHLSVLIPYTPSSGRDNGIRERNFKWVLHRYEQLFRGVEVCIGEDRIGGNGEKAGAGPEPFSRAAAINDASRKATREIFAVTDADVFYDPRVIYDSVQLLDKSPWVIPYMRVHRLTERSSIKILESDPKIRIGSGSLGLEDEETIDIRTAGYKYVSMLNIMPRSVFEKVGGFDERFRGWGFEDDAFTISVNTIFGPYSRIDADIYHLWHPRPIVPKDYYQRSSILFARYKEAEGNREAMERLISERSSGKIS